MAQYSNPRTLVGGAPRPRVDSPGAKRKFFEARGWTFYREGAGWFAKKAGSVIGPRPCIRSLCNRVQVEEARH